ncbi:MAG: hypothetical protein ACXVB0_09250 [Mucilaginibacter sp.]
MESLKKSTTLKSLIVIMIVLSVYSCKKGNSPLPSTKASQVAFGVKAVNSSTILTASASKLTVNSVSTAPVIQFTSGVANIAEFKLEAKTANSSVEIRTKNLMNVDLFALNPAVVTATLDTGTYQQIEVRVELVQSADTSAIPLKLKGSFSAADGTVIPVEFDINENLTIKAEATNVLLHSTGDLSTIVQLHLDKIVAGITASDLTSADKTGGVIIISNTSNINLFNKIKFNVEGCGDTEVKEDHGGHGNDGSGHN